jgi:hypothetical protein
MPDDARKPSAWDKSKLPSRHITVGPERAPHRAMFYAMGVTEEQLNAGSRRRAARRANSPPSPSPTVSPWAMTG